MYYVYTAAELRHYSRFKKINFKESAPRSAQIIVHYLQLYYSEEKRKLIIRFSCSKNVILYNAFLYLLWQNGIGFVVEWEKNGVCCIPCVSETSAKVDDEYQNVLSRWYGRVLATWNMSRTYANVLTRT